MFEIIISMANVKVSKTFPSLKIVVHYVGDDEREVEKMPHGHVFLGNKRLAQISLDPPFSFFEGGDKVPTRMVRLLRNFLTDNQQYIHFVWKEATGQNDYMPELLKLSPETVESFRLRFNNDNPNHVITRV